MAYGYGVGGRSLIPTTTQSPETLAATFMKLTLFLASLMLPLFIFSQKIWVHTDYHENGQLHWKGNMLEVDNSSSPVGLWEYWYEDGSKQLETWDDSSSKSYYLNMWLPNGEQILKNGQGVLYEIWPLGGNEWDSSVYQIKDSIKQGYYKGYRSYPGGKYFLAYQGQYDKNSKKTGEWKFKDTIYKSWLIENYNNGKLNGLKEHFYMDGMIKDSGQYKNDEQHSEWKYYYQDNTIGKVCSYTGGRLIGIYKEYYPSGQLKVEGLYSQGKGFIKVNIRSIGRSKIHNRSEKRLITNKALKQGIWKYFDKGGKLIKKETYKNDVKI